MTLKLSAPAVRTLCTVLVAWLALEACLIRPHYLSYINELAGGPRNGYHHLIDSAVDWGQDLPALATYLKSAPPDVPIYLAYFGTSDAAHYGVHDSPLPSMIPRLEEERPDVRNAELAPGLYCVSVTLLEGMYGEWTTYTPEREQSYQHILALLPQRATLLADPKITGDERHKLEVLPEQLRWYEFARLLAYLRQRRPNAQAGYSINIYALSPQEFSKAMTGPPFFDQN